MNAVKVDYKSGFYVVGGTMRADAPSYIERHADKALYEALMRSEFCYILTARQMGKSSLMIRTAVRLRQAGIGVAVLDLTAVGQNLSAQQWYGGLLVQVGQRLGMEEELIKFWPSQPMLGPMQRWIKAIRTVVLPNISGPLVILVDEIDVVRSLPFSTDEFFASLRECYNQRSEDTEMSRLTFCLSGVASPTDLIRDTRTTPFNIGHRIELNDFTEAEAAPLAYGLGRGQKQGAAILRRVLYWTGGHPYLTQRLCKFVAEECGEISVDGVDHICEELFFSRRAQERDPNLLFVRERMLRSEADLTALLQLYARVRSYKTVEDDETNSLVSILRLSGITRTHAGRLTVRNRIYARVFDKAWIAASLPDAELRRQRAAYRRGVWRTAAVSASILVLLGLLAFLAIKQGNLAKQQAAYSRRLLYFAQMKLALQEWEDANVDRMEELLNSYIPRANEEDLRGFEWYVLSRLAHQDIFRRKEDHKIANVTFLPDGETLAVGEVLSAKPSGSSEYLIKLINWKTEAELSSFAVPAGKNFDFVVFSPDKQFVAVDGPQNDITLWDVNSGQQQAIFKGHTEVISIITFSPDGKRLASGDLNGVLKIWEAKTGKEIFTLKEERRRILSAAFSPDGRWLVTADGSHLVRLWDTISGRQLPAFEIKENEPSRAVFFPDGKKLVIATKDGHLFLADGPGKKLMPVPTPHSNEITTIAFSPDCKTLATGSTDRVVKLSDAATGQERLTIKGHGSEIKSVEWSAEGAYLVTGSRDGTIKIWNANAKPELILPPCRVKEYFSTAFLADRDLIALGSTEDLQVKLWNLSTGQELARLDEAGDNILCAAFSPDKKIVATGGRGQENLVKFWDITTGKLLRTYEGHTAFVYSIDFSPDGKLFISGGNDDTLRLWDVASGQQIALLYSEVDNYYRAVFSPDGKRLASACRDGTVNLWDMETLSVTRTLIGHTDSVRAIAFSQDGHWLVTGGMDNTIRLWDLAGGQEPKILGLSDSIQRAAFSSDGQRVITGGTEGSVKLWDLTTFKDTMVLKGHAGAVSSVTFSADGMDLATSGTDGTVRLWCSLVKEESIFR